ncbi:MAG: hypothetical protein Sylvanvirus10_9 [Sylvanvirus sp.]|uniref:F-box domain-containing protein n=1 Tax=Sylvanvirus sp. TaxID=2487774 RepID=A0A3G5AHW8_9VIRU|nr:MAG: hypothetical protein Sylvanvirus10_9 [Sylvanvirus sp.]
MSFDIKAKRPRHEKATPTVQIANIGNLEYQGTFKFNFKWMLRIGSFLPPSSLVCVGTLSTQFYEWISHSDVWKDVSMTYAIHINPGCCSTPLFQGFWKYIQHVYIPPLIHCTNILSINMSHLQSVQSLHCGNIMFFNLLLFLDTSNIILPVRKLHIVMEEQSLFNAQVISKTDRWGLLFPYVEILCCSIPVDPIHLTFFYRHMDQCEHMFKGARYLQNIREISLTAPNELTVGFKGHRESLWLNLVKMISTYTRDIRSLSVSYCAKGCLDWILGSFPSLTELNIPTHFHGVSGLTKDKCVNNMYLRPLQWNHLFGSSSFQWTEVTLEIYSYPNKEYKDCDLKVLLSEDLAADSLVNPLLEQLCDNKFTPFWIRSTEYNSLQSSSHIYGGVCDIKFLFYRPGFTFLRSLTLFFTSDAYPNLDLNRCVGLKSLLHLTSFELQCSRFVTTELFVQLLLQCFHLPLSIRTFRLPLSSYRIPQSSCDLIMLFRRLKNLEHLAMTFRIQLFRIFGRRIKKKNAMMQSMYYSQRYLPVLVRLQSISFPLLHCLTYTQRNEWLQDIPISLRHLHSPGLCLYRFSLLRDRKTTGNWWSPYIDKLTNLRCMSLPSSICASLSNIGFIDTWYRKAVDAYKCDQKDHIHQQEIKSDIINELKECCVLLAPHTRQHCIHHISNDTLPLQSLCELIIRR